MDIKKYLQTYMLNYPDSYVGFLSAVSDILKELGEEWTNYGKKEWGDVFTASALQILQTAINLSKIRNAYNKEQQLEEIPGEVKDEQQGENKQG